MALTWNQIVARVAAESGSASASRAGKRAEAAAYVQSDAIRATRLADQPKCPPSLRRSDFRRMSGQNSFIASDRHTSACNFFAADPANAAGAEDDGRPDWAQADDSPEEIQYRSPVSVNDCDRPASQACLHPCSYAARALLAGPSPVSGLRHPPGGASCSTAGGPHVCGS